MELRSITVETLAAFAQALRAEERCTETIKQYTRSVRQFAAWLAPETVAAGSAGGWKAAPYQNLNQVMEALREDPGSVRVGGTYP